MITAEYLRGVLDYDPKIGVFRWAVSRGRVRAGDAAGTKVGAYIEIRVGGTRFLAHRLAWIYCNGTWPTGDVDHINRDKTDNRISNLRLATKPQNQANAKLRANNTSGYRGVCWNRQRGLWRATIRVHGGRRKTLGDFASKEEAAAAYRAAISRRYGEYVGELQ